MNELEKLRKRFLERLKQIREYEWNNYDIKIQEEFEVDGCLHKGVRHGETALEAIARHMTDVIKEIIDEEDGSVETLG